MEDLYFVPKSVEILDGETLFYDPFTVWNGWRNSGMDAREFFSNLKRVPKDKMNLISEMIEEQKREATHYYGCGRYFDNILYDCCPIPPDPFPRVVQVWPKSDLKIKKIIFRNPATIVFWEDNTKTVVKVHSFDGVYFVDRYDPELGVFFCYLKKIFGKGYYETISNLVRHEKDILFQFVRKVIFSDQMTILIWDDGTKTYAKCNEGYYNEEKAVAICILKKIYGGSFYVNVLKPTINKFLEEK